MTETVIARLLSDILTALDAGDIAAFALLDLSAAFDTVDHSILLRRLQRSCGLCGSVLSWFGSYLDGRRHYVSVNSEHSDISETKFGVPQGSVLGPIIFIMYTADVICIAERSGLRVHQFDDDTQIYGSCRPHQSASLCREFGVCVESVERWTSSNRLQLNADKARVHVVCSNLVADINFLMNRCWLALSPWRQSTLFATLECIWTQTCRWIHIQVNSSAHVSGS